MVSTFGAAMSHRSPVYAQQQSAGVSSSENCASAIRLYHEDESTSCDEEELSTVSLMEIGCNVPSPVCQKQKKARLAIVPRRQR
jgi:hypothetical protein